MIDDRGALVYGNADPGTISGRLTFPMLFYPAEDIQARMSGGAVTREAEQFLEELVPGFQEAYREQGTSADKNPNTSEMP